MKLLVTGCAGFIGAAVCQKALTLGYYVVGIDNLNDYYDPALKKARLNNLAASKHFQFYPYAIHDEHSVVSVFENEKFTHVIHLAAQAGVRYSLENPQAYVESNLKGFVNILEACRKSEIKHLVFASSSSVYGMNQKFPYSIHDNVDHPVSLYAATKKSNELMAHAYSQLYRLPVTGLRYFTVYGPWGRPDMAPMQFATAIMKGEPIKVYNQGHHERDFTFIDDIVDGTLKVLEKIPEANQSWLAEHPDPATSNAPYRIYNIGRGKPEKLLDFIELLENHLGKKAQKEFLPKQPGDVLRTFADITDLARDIGYSPQISLEQGIPQFIAWFKQYYIRQ
ncbi:MAG: NAD-dependent epimerase [Gammaproteobacteria bacterium]